MNRSVAVLDIRSSEVSVMIGERGVNHTFVFKAGQTQPYDGYEREFYDPAGLAEAVYSCLASVEKTTNAHITKLYVGVPGPFCRVVPKEQVAGFSKKRKITDRETEALFEGGKTELEGYRFIRATSMIYVTADNRRVVEPRGLSSPSLTGVLSYFYCSEYFAGTIEKIMEKRKCRLCFLPTQLAMADYLIDAETRDEYALFFDSGFLDSTVSVVLGGGILAQKSFCVGKGHIVVRLMEKLHLPYDAACALLARTNLYSKGGGKAEFFFRGISYEYDADTLVETVKYGLDEICEAISGFLEECSGRELDFKPLYVTGEGIPEIRGAAEHVSKRVNRVLEVLSPDLPYYNKPSMSSRIALIDAAYEDNRQSGFLNRLFHTFGGSQ